MNHQHPASLLYSYCYVKGCRFNTFHSTQAHKCGSCGRKGHGKIECSIADNQYCTIFIDMGACYIIRKNKGVTETMLVGNQDWFYNSESITTFIGDRKEKIL